MHTYLLLRDNRQQGPFTMEQLISKGLKPYDLVWAEGKSAAWRYPGEIPELSAYAPLVEEQPFDRFYKKPETKNEVDSRVIPPAETVKKQEPEPVKKSGRIYVHVPASNFTASRPAFPAEKPSLQSSTQNLGQEHTTPVQTVPTSERLPSTPQSIPQAHERFLPETNKVENSHGVPGRIIPEKENLPSEKITTRELYPDHSDKYRKEIAQPETDFAPNTPVSQLPPSIQKSALQRYIQKPAFVAAMLLVVIAAALAAILLNNTNGKTPQLVQQTPVVPPPPPPQVEETPVNGENEPPVSSAASFQQEEKAQVPTTSIPSPSASNSKESALPPVVKKEDLAVSKLPPVAKRDQSADDNKDDYAKNELPMDRKERKTWKYEELPVSTENGVRSKTTRNESTPVVNEEAPKEKPVVKTAAVSLGTPAFTKGTLGGIYDVSIPVKNNSANKIDLLIVEVQYIKANGEVLQTKKLSLDHLLPGEQYTLKAPDSPRGVKLNCAVSLVTAGSGISMVQQ